MKLETLQSLSLPKETFRRFKDIFFFLTFLSLLVFNLADGTLRRKRMDFRHVTEANDLTCVKSESRSDIVDRIRLFSKIKLPSEPDHKQSRNSTEIGEKWPGRGPEVRDHWPARPTKSQTHFSLRASERWGNYSCCQKLLCISGELMCVYVHERARFPVRVLVPVRTRSGRFNAGGWMKSAAALMKGRCLNTDPQLQSKRTKRNWFNVNEFLSCVFVCLCEELNELLCFRAANMVSFTSSLN